MKKLVLAVVFAAGALGMGATGALAQEAEPAQAKMRLGAEGAFVLPIGDWADASGIGIGVMGRLDYMVTPKLAVTGHPGYIFHLGKEVEGTGIELSTTELLITGGVRYFVTPELSVGAETGFNIWTVKASADGESDSESENRVPLLLGGGYTSPAGLTVSGYLIVPNLLMTEDDEDTQMGVMLTVGYMAGR